MQKFVIHIEDTGESYTATETRSVLEGMEALGKKGIPVGCRQGGCGVCKVQVLEGAVRHLGPVSCAHVSDLERDQGYTLACRVAPLEAVRIAVAQRLHKPFFLRAASPAPTTHGTPTSN